MSSQDESPQKPEAPGPVTTEQLLPIALAIYLKDRPAPPPAMGEREEVERIATTFGLQRRAAMEALGLVVASRTAAFHHQAVAGHLRKHHAAAESASEFIRTVLSKEPS